MHSVSTHCFHLPSIAGFYFVSANAHQLHAKTKFDPAPLAYCPTRTAGDRPTGFHSMDRRSCPIGHRCTSTGFPADVYYRNGPQGAVFLAGFHLWAPFLGSISRFHLFHFWVPILGSISGFHLWLPSLGFLGSMSGFGFWGVPSLGSICGSHLWVPFLGSISGFHVGAPSFSVFHFWVPFSHFWIPFPFLGPISCFHF